MFRRLSELISYRVGTVDGNEGSISDFLFDDKNRIVRYVVVDTGGWLLEKNALISPVAVESIDNESRCLKTVLNRASVEGAPGIESDRPVSRQQEVELVSYYNWPIYWAPMMSGTLPGNNVAVAETATEEWDPHLRSTKEVIGYSINCIGDSMGHVADLIVDTDSWVVRYLVIDTSHWLPGKKVIVGFDWLTDIRWNDKSVFVDLTRKQIETAPPFDPKISVNREYEATLYDFYGRPTYW
jgi:uncharacterized protein YrrD